MTIAATIAGIFSFIYLLFIGQKSIPELWRERRIAKHKKTVQSESNSSTAILHNLPHRGDFVGRKHEKRLVHDALFSTASVVLIDGIGGIGKTSLALEVLHECLAASQITHAVAEKIRRFDAFIWTSAKDHDLTLNEVFDTIARTLGYAFLTQLPLEDKRHEIIKRLQEKSCLLIVDNFETIADKALNEFIFLIPETSKCLITSRVQTFQQTKVVSLLGITKEETQSLIKNEGNRLGLDLTTLIYEEDSFLRFYNSTGGAPLAIRWSIGQIKQRGQSIDSVLNNLNNAKGSIFEYIFERAWSLLTEYSTQVLLIMPIFAKSVLKTTIQAASEVRNECLDESLGQLVELWLLEVNRELNESKRRYSIHPLTRVYAQKKLAGYPDLELQARLRQVAFYQKSFGENYWTWEKWDEIEEERENIFALIDWCFENKQEISGMKLTKSASSFMNLNGYHFELMNFGRKAIEVARKEGETADYAWLLLDPLGWREIHGGNLESGERLAREALRIFEQLNESDGVRFALLVLGRALRFRKDFEGAQENNQKGLALAQAAKNEFDVAMFMRELALIDEFQDNLEKAKNSLDLILNTFQDQEHWLKTVTLEDLARVNHKLGNYEAAYTTGQTGLKLAKRIKRGESIAWISLTLSYVEKERGNYQSALSFAQQALEYFERSRLFPKRIKELKTLIKELQNKLSTSSITSNDFA